MPGKCRGTCKVGDTVVEQELIYEKLPGDIAKRHVLLMDPILAMGNSAARAIQVSLLLCNYWLLLCNLCLRRLVPAHYQGLLVCCALNLPPIAGVLFPEFAPNRCQV